MYGRLAQYGRACRRGLLPKKYRPCSIAPNFNAFFELTSEDRTGKAPGLRIASKASH